MSPGGKRCLRQSSACASRLWPSPSFRGSTQRRYPSFVLPPAAAASGRFERCQNLAPSGGPLWREGRLRGFLAGNPTSTCCQQSRLGDSGPWGTESVLAIPGLAEAKQIQVKSILVFLGLGEAGGAGGPGIQNVAGPKTSILQPERPCHGTRSHVFANSSSESVLIDLPVGVLQDVGVVRPGPCCSVPVLGRWCVHFSWTFDLERLSFGPEGTGTNSRIPQCSSPNGPSQWR